MDKKNNPKVGNNKLSNYRRSSLFDLDKRSKQISKAEDFIMQRQADKQDLADKRDKMAFDHLDTLIRILKLCDAGRYGSEASEVKGTILDDARNVLYRLDSNR